MPKKRKDGRYQRKITLSDGRQKIVYGRTLAELNAAADEAVTSNIAIAASAAQDVFGSVQNVGGKYWDPTATFGQMIANGDLKADDDAAIQTALDTLVEGVTAPVE